MDTRADKNGVDLRIALLGAPNCGKTSLFNALTGGRAKVANYPGVTVEYAKGRMVTEKGRVIEFLDLPGVYGDCGHSADERVTIDAVNGRLKGEKRPDAIMVVMDATHIRTHLHNVLQAKNYGLPMVVVLNMMDMAARDGVEIDVAGLEQALGVPVIPCVAVRSAGRQAVMTLLSDWADDVESLDTLKPEPTHSELKQIQKIARAISSQTVKEPRTGNLTERLDRILLHPILGPMILAALMFFMFQAVYAWSAPLIGFIEQGIAWLGGALTDILPDGPIESLIVNGIIGGVGAVLVFLPQIIILFAFILALEASGYLARAAFLVDTLMAKVGLNGRAFIPLLSSFACAVPGIMAARTIDNERDRLTTILIAPLMTCSARWPVYFLLVGAFIPDLSVGPFNLRGVVMSVLVLIGIIFALISAFILRHTVTKGKVPPLLMELPGYKLPSLKSYLLGLWQRAKIFLNRAGRIILPASVIIWFLSTYPNQDGDIRHSFAGMIGRVIEPVLAPIGFNLEMSIALIPAMAAREVAVSTLAIVYGASDSHVLGSMIGSNWSLPTGLAFLAWFIFAPSCIATLAITRKETNSWKWPIIMFIYLIILAYIGAGLTYYGAKALGL